MFKRTATDLSRQATTTKLKLTRYSNMPGCCYINYFFEHRAISRFYS